MFIRFVLLLNIIYVLCVYSKTPQLSKSEIESHLGSKTPYRIIANKNDSVLKYEGCTPTRIWAIIRHGTRNPSRKYIQYCKKYLPHIRDRIIRSTKTKLNISEINELREWDCDINESEEKYLVYEGEDELLELGERMHNRFPSLIPEIYDPFHYKFKYTATQRTAKSAESFTIGLFGRHNINQIIYPEPLHKDPILRFYKLCPRWRAEIKKNPDATIEKRKFQEGKEMMNALNSIAKKTGITGIEANDAELIYTMCGFETAWNKRKVSPWCALFDYDSIRVMEYLKDLHYYWVDGYGHNLTRNLACPAIADMINHISPFSSEPNATFYFTHSGTILKILTHLNLYKDDFVLKHTEYGRKRQWMVSKIDSFASNIAFVSFSCPRKKTKVLLMHQERIVHLPGCPVDQDLCSLERVKEILDNSIYNCDFENACKIS